MGINDQNASGKDRQLHQKPLELHHEKEEPRADGNPLRYFPHNPDLILKKKTSFLTKAEVGEHFVRIERELLAAIYENKENVIKIKDRNIVSKATEFGQERKKLMAVEDSDRDKNLTVLQNRVIDHQQFHSKTTEKFVDNESRNIPFSSIKKSERSMALRENFGSLIFETPPKGKPDRLFYKFDSSRFFMDRIELSPTPIKDEVVEREEQVLNLLSPSKFMIASDRKPLS